MQMEKEGKSLADIRRTVEARYDPKNGLGTRTPLAAEAGREESVGRRPFGSGRKTEVKKRPAGLPERVSILSALVPALDGV